MAKSNGSSRAVFGASTLLAFVVYWWWQRRRRSQPYSSPDRSPNAVEKSASVKPNGKGQVGRVVEGAECVSPLPMGQRLLVLDEDHHNFFPGEVESFHAETGLHQVRFDDGVIAWLDLRHEHVQLLAPENDAPLDEPLCPTSHPVAANINPVMAKSYEWVAKPQAMQESGGTPEIEEVSPEAAAEDTVPVVESPDTGPQEIDPLTLTLNIVGDDHLQRHEKIGAMFDLFQTDGSIPSERVRDLLNGMLGPHRSKSQKKKLKNLRRRVLSPSHGKLEPVGRNVFVGLIRDLFPNTSEPEFEERARTGVSKVWESTRL